MLNYVAGLGPCAGLNLAMGHCKPAGIDWMADMFPLSHRMSDLAYWGGQGVEQGMPEPNCDI